MNHSLFGWLNKFETHWKYSVNLSSVKGTLELNLEIIEQSKICSVILKLEHINCIKGMENLWIFASDIHVKENSFWFKESSAKSIF